MDFSSGSSEGYCPCAVSESNLSLDNYVNNWRVIYGFRDIFASLLESTKSLKLPTIAYDRTKRTEKIVVSIQPVV